MQFRIADTFTDSIAKLTGDEQKAVKITICTGLKLELSIKLGLLASYARNLKEISYKPNR